MQTSNKNGHVYNTELNWCKNNKGSQLDSFKGLFRSDNKLKNINFLS